MLLLLLILIVLFLLMPLDAQEAIAQALGGVLSIPLAPYFAAGALGALVVALLAYNHIWNALSYSIYLADEARARENHQRRKR
jgi:uncharacterized membrane protein YsdA (DUF1294 family)